MLNADQAVLVVIDVQGKLAGLMHDRDELFDNLARLLRGAEVLELPVICTEQNPQALGPTRPEIAPLIKADPIAKLSFSCCREPRFMDRLERLGGKQVLLAGIEAHICVYQTALELIDRGWGVHVAADAVSSRKRANRDIALGEMARSGARLTSVEGALFEMLAVAEGEKFKRILSIVK